MNIWLGRGGLISGFFSLGMMVWAFCTHQAPWLLWFTGLYALVCVYVNVWMVRTKRPR